MLNCVINDGYCFVCWGARVVMACRNMELCETVRSSIIEKTCNRNVHCEKLDLASLASVREFADGINRSKWCICANRDQCGFEWPATYWHYFVRSVITLQIVMIFKWFMRHEKHLYTRRNHAKIVEWIKLVYDSMLASLHCTTVVV